MLAALLAFAMQSTGWPACTGSARYCEVPLPPARELRAIIGRRAEAWRARNGVLTVVARRSRPATLCCALQGPLRTAGTGLQAIALRVTDIDSAIIDVHVFADPPWQRNGSVYRGSQAPPAPPAVPHDRGRYTYHRIASRYLGEVREVYVYLPPHILPGARLPTVYMADGLSPQLADVVEGLWQRREVAPFILVGISISRRRCEGEYSRACDGRALEYLAGIPGVPPEQSRFDAHANFVTHELIPILENSLPIFGRREDRIVGGYSNGGAWALSMAARGQDRFGGTIVMSNGSTPAADEAGTLKSGNIFVGGSLLEGQYYEQSRRAAENARRAGANVRLVTPNAGHSMENWEILFADALRWHFPPTQR